MCTVKNSWWRTEELSETCRVSFQNKFENLVHLVGFILRNIVFICLKIKTVYILAADCQERKLTFKNMLQLQCCGIEGPKDWDRNNYFNCSSRDVGSREACGVPFSCCKRKPNVSMCWALVYGALHVHGKTCVSLDLVWFVVLSFFIHPTLRHNTYFCMVLTGYGISSCLDIATQKSGLGHMTNKFH